MIAPKLLAERFRPWNVEVGAPAGSGWWARLARMPLLHRIYRLRFLLPEGVMRRIGMFGFQLNSPTRVVEYPWVYETLKGSQGARVIDLGSGASGLQFLLSARGMEVISVDPLVDVEGSSWTFSTDSIGRLNKVFGTNVTFVREYLERANFPSGYADWVISISMLEHLPREAITALMKEVARILAPGGHFVATIDLFMDLAPFGSQERNEWGTNVDVREVVESSGLQLVVGRTHELVGFPDFSPQEILRRRGEFFAPRGVASQMIVLRKMP